MSSEIKTKQGFLPKILVRTLKSQAWKLLLDQAKFVWVA